MSEKMIDVTVMVDDKHKDQLSKVAGELQKKGFVVSESLKEIGVLLGSVAEEAIDKLSVVPGVSAVEKNRRDYRTQQN